MSKVTVADLQAKLQRANSIIGEQQKKIQGLYQEKEKLLNSKNTFTKAEYEVLLKDIKRLQLNYEKIKNLYDQEKEKNNVLINGCMAVRIHNERGAGRKSKLTTEQIKKVKQLRNEGKSYGAISKEVGMSKAYVYKLIKKD
jgi:hypothetical protein